MNSASIQKTVFKVSDFLSWQRNSSLVLSPNFQRRPVWPPGAKSLLMDTIVKGIPIPIIFLRQRTDLESLEPRREVVDGQQRLRTIISFISPSLLKDYEAAKDDFVVKRSHNSEMSGKTFQNLPPSMRSKILDYEFSVHVLPSDTDDREILQIFARMNSTGYKLNDQELRNAAWFGEYKNVAYELAYQQLSRWREWRVFSETDIARMIEVEETSDLIALMLQGLHGKSSRLLDSLYKQYDDVFAQRDEVAARFQSVMDRIATTAGDIIAHTEFRRRPLFNTLFSYYYDVMYGIGGELRKARAGATPTSVKHVILAASDKIAEGNIPDELLKSLRGATGNLASRKARLKFVQDVAKSVAK